MTTLMEQEKQRISQRLARLDAEREKLSGEFDELEIAERVLARFRAESGYNREAKQSTPGKNNAGGCRGGSRPKRPESASHFDPRRQFEGRTGA